MSTDDCPDKPVNIERGAVKAVAPERITKSFNFFLNGKEMAALDKLAESKGMTKSNLMRQAFRLYQMIDMRLANGERIYFSGDRGKVETEIIL